MRAFEPKKLVGLIIIITLVLGSSPLSMGATTVKRNISKKTTWKKRKSPYVVTKDIVVESGATLKIEAGVRVELEADRKIEIRGNFLAIGTPDQPIIFTGKTEKPWGTLNFTDFSEDAVFTEKGEYISGCILKHCVIEKGRGVFVRFGAPLITDCKIRNNFSSGIRVEFGAPRITRNHISNNSTQHDPASGNGGGIIAYTDKNMLITDNIINNNISDGGRDGGGGVYSYSSDKAHIIVRDNIIYGNTSSRFGGGIYAYNSIVSGNTIINNTAAQRGGGLYVVESRLVENTIQSNNSEVGGGIFAENSEIVSNSIIRNKALKPGGGALHYFGSGNIRENCFVSNIAEGDQACGGIFVSGNPDIEANNFFTNSGYALYIANVTDAPEVSAKGNFWGVSSEQDVLRLTYDWLDNEGVGLANTVPFLKTMSPNPPLPPPFNLIVSATEEGIRLSWDEPSGIRFEGHTIRFGPMSGYPYVRLLRTGPENNYLIRDLEPGVKYHFAVSGNHHILEEEIETGFSEEVSALFTSSEASLDPPTILQPIGTESNGIKNRILKANLPMPDSQVSASRWQVTAFADDFTALLLDTVKTGDALSEFSLEGANLSGGEHYFWRMAYQNAAGNWSEWSVQSALETDQIARSILSGPISGETKLEKRFSPYRMSGNTLITPAGKLMIEPGVRVNVAPGKSLLVRGKLVARGTKSEPISFMPETTEKWGQIIFSDTSEDIVLKGAGNYVDGCVLERCVIENGRGILVKSSSPLIKDCNISNNDGSGIAVRQGGPVITGNDIHHNTAPTNGGGIYAYTNDVAHVLSNKIHDNRADGDGGGVYAYGYMNTSAIRVEGNHIFANEATGDGGGTYLSRSSAIGNRITSNRANGAGGGIYTTFGLVSSNELSENRANRGGGIFAEQNSSMTDNNVTANKAESGLGGGVYINFWGTSIENESFIKNTVTKNSGLSNENNGGVFIVGYLFFEQNNIHGNRGNQLYNGNESGSYSLNATQCYWGTDDRNEIAKQIVDKDDDPELGEVIFEPFLGKPLHFD